MSSIPKGSERGPQANPTEALETGAAAVASAERDEDIRRRAYEIYLDCGEQPGRELDDWLQAERELRRGDLARGQAG
jgi:Protein of unknown function (DUF2934)